jgi:prepilin-type N-terminal cleavage/methylation domain-containing protein
MIVHESTKPDTRQGFTLIELSIVLVIIGLIVGGILVGQDLIKAAEIRATVAQVEKYNSAVNTFRSKYNGIPGDIPVATASAFGLFTETTLGGTAGHGDGNGLLEGGSGGATVGIGETLSFWRHMSDANLIDGQLGTTGNSLIVVTDGTLTGNVTTINQSLPTSKTTPTGAFVAYAASGINYYQLLPVTGITDGAGTYTMGTTGLTPTQAYNMDIKLDDGMPITGIVQAKGIAAINAVPSAQVASTAATCVMGDTAGTDTADTYNRVQTTGGSDPSCAVRFRFN